MKKLIIMLAIITCTLGVSAQKIGRGYGGGSRVYYPTTRTYYPAFSYGFGFGYPYFGYPYYGYPYYGNPYYGSRRLPYQLDLQIQQINNDYKGKIADAKSDKTLKGAARRQEIRNLKMERDHEIIQAKMDYANANRRGKANRQNTNPQGNNDNDNGNNNGNNNGNDNGNNSNTNPPANNSNQ